jgi:hypothetical protein
MIFSQSTDLEKVLEKNIKAVGGKEKIESIKNYSFRLNSENYYISCDGIMKITKGKKPIIVETIIANENSVKRNCFNKISEFKDFRKALYQCLAKLYSGIFTLSKFKGELIYHGLKKFGIEKLHCLSVKKEDIRANFYIDSQEFILKRIVFEGYENGEKVEINYDFGPYKEVNGIRIPSSWYVSQIGARGKVYKISKFKINLDLSEDYFKKLEINAGKVEISDGELKGNIIDFNFSRGRLIIQTNWIGEHFEKAGFKSDENLILKINNENIEVTLFKFQPPRNAFGRGKRLILPNRAGENYLIYLWTEQAQSLAEKLSILSLIKLKRK